MSAHPDPRAPAPRRFACALVLALALGPVHGRASAAASAGDTLTLAECVTLARQHAPDVLATAHERRAAVADSVATAFNRRPDLALVAGATIAPKGYYDPALTNLGDYELKASLDWPLADGGRRARERTRSALEAAAARARAALGTRDAGLAAADLATRLLRLQDAGRIERRALEWIERLRVLVRSGVASGLRTSTDSLRVLLERDAAMAALEGTELDTRTTTLELARLTGRDPASALVVREPGEEDERAPATADSLRLLDTLDRLPELALARVTEATGRLDVEEARRRTAPTVDFSLDAGLAGTDLTRAVPVDLLADDPSATFGDRLHRDLGASAAFHLRLPVLDRAAPAATRAREAALRAAEVRRTAEEDTQREQALVLLARWRSACHRLDAARLTCARAEQNLLKVKSLYAAGATTLLDLLDALRVSDEASDRLAESRQDARFAQFQVEDRR